MADDSQQSETRTSTPEDMLVCPICLGIFETPRALACLHTFCEPCLEFHLSDALTTAKKGRLASIKCPVCSQETIPRDNRKLPHIMVKDLPLNHFLLPFLESFEVFRSPSRRSRKHTPKTIMRNCGTCAERGEVSEATSYCNECEEFQCDACLKSHNSNKVLKKHTVVPIDKVTSVSEMISNSFEKNNTCLEHQSENLKCFCIDHEVLLCSTCVIESHKACEIVSDFSELGKKIVNSKQPSQLQDNIKGLQKVLVEVSEAAEDNNHNIKKEAEDIIWRIQTMKTSVLKLFDRLEANVTTGLKEYQEQYGKHNSEKAFKCKQIAAALESSYKTIDSLLDFASDHQIFTTFQRLKMQLQDYDKMVKAETKDVEVAAFHFKVDSKLSELIVNADDLGELTVERKKPTLSDAPVLALPAQQNKEEFDATAEFLTSIDIKAKAKHVQWTCLSVCTMENKLALLFSVLNRAWMSYTVKILHPDTLEELISIDVKRDPKQILPVDMSTFVVSYPIGGFIEFFTYTAPAKKRKKKPAPPPSVTMSKTVKCDIRDVRLCRYSKTDFGYSTCNYFGLMDHDGVVKHLFLYSVSLGERETNFWCTQLIVDQMVVDWRRKRIYVATSRPRPKLYSFAENGVTMFEFNPSDPVVSLDLDQLSNVCVLTCSKGGKTRLFQISANTGKAVREVDIQQSNPRFVTFNKKNGDFYITGHGNEKSITMVEKYAFGTDQIKEDLFKED